MTPTVAFLTALPLEFEAVVKHLENQQVETVDQRNYTISERNGWRVVVRQQSSQGNYQAVRETDWLIQHFQPSYLFFIGVAGGIKDVNLGDVVVATLAKGYESVKIKDGVTYPRLHVEYSSQDLVEQAVELARTASVKTWVGAIASGEKLVSDEKFLNELKLHCSDAVAVEMEAIGFLGSIRQHEGSKGIVIRGISDMIVGKNADDDKQYQPIVAQNAAAFAFALLDKLKVPEITQQVGSGIPLIEYLRVATELGITSERLGVTQKVLDSFLETVGKQHVPLEKLDSTLTEIAQRYKELLAKVATFTSDDPEVKRLLTEAQTALEATDFDEAEQLYNQASDRYVASSQTAPRDCRETLSLRGRS